MLNGLDLFSGCGGLALALAPWVRPVAYCEIERSTQRLLLSRMGKGELHLAPIWDDVRTLSADKLREPCRFSGSIDPERKVDIITGGFPCQNTSVAGDGSGLDGEKSGLFWELIRLTDETRPRWVFLENTCGVERWLPQIVQAFRDIGYILDPDDCGVLGAWEVGAGHERDRWWALAYADGMRELQPQGSVQRFRGRISDSIGPVSAHPDSQRLQRPEQPRVPKTTEFELPPWAATSKRAWVNLASDLVRDVHGATCRMDRIRAMGLGVVPLQARTAFQILSGLKVI
jgi:DNA (cytosine-5)-methyltransferase 1